MSNDITLLPPWAQSWASTRLEQHTRTGAVVDAEEWTGLRDWLAALPRERPRMVGKMHKLTLEQALLAQARWHEDMARRTARLAAERAGFGGDPDAVEVVAGSAIDSATEAEHRGWRWVRVTTPAGLDYEGAAMGHCVGWGSYDEATIYSLRDGDNMPHCTIEYDPDSRTVEQVQGRANGVVVERYHGAVVSFINVLEPARVQGASKFGHVLVDGKLLHWRDIRPDTTIDGDLDLRDCLELEHLPTGLHVKGMLFLRGCRNLKELPQGLRVDSRLSLLGCESVTCLPPDIQTGDDIDLEGCTALTHLPDNMHVQGSLDIRDCTALRALPRGLRVDVILYMMRCTAISRLPAGLRANLLINAEGCSALTVIEPGIETRRLSLEACTTLEKLPEGLQLEYLDLTSCTSLKSLPRIKVSERMVLTSCTSLVQLPEGIDVKSLVMHGCTSVEGLPDDIKVKITLNVSACSNLRFLPQGLDLVGRLDICGCTGLRDLPTRIRASTILLGDCPQLKALPEYAHIKATGGDCGISRGWDCNTSIPQTYGC